MVARSRGSASHDGIRIEVRLTPRGGSDRIDGVEDGILRVRVAAPPADGAANESLLRLLAASLDLPRRALRLVAGAASRSKVVLLEDVADGGLDRRVQAQWPGLRRRFDPRRAPPQ